MKTEEELREWEESARKAGDSETMLIAMVALGESFDPDAGWECGRRRALQISRMTQFGAARIAAQCIDYDDDDDYEPPR